MPDALSLEQWDHVSIDLIHEVGEPALEADATDPPERDRSEPVAPLVAAAEEKRADALGVSR